MIKILFIFFIFYKPYVFASPTHTISQKTLDTIKDIHLNSPTLFKWTFKQLISQKCQHQGFPTQKCTEYSSLTIQLLDIELFEDNNKITAVVFKTELLELLKSDDITTYLSKVLDMLVKEEHLDLWKFTLNKSKSAIKALKWISILFQDTTEQMSHLKYAQKHGYIDRPNYKVLKKILNLINSPYFNILNIQPYLLSHISSTKALPRHGFYHFYVPSYLAYKLNENNVDLIFSNLLPGVFNFIYEVLTKKSPTKELFMSQPPFNEFSYYTQREIEAGYLGAYFGTQIFIKNH